MAARQGFRVISRLSRGIHTSCRRQFLIPMVIEQTITDETSSLVVAQLLFLQSENGRTPVHMYINSPGGSVTAGLAIYDTMQYIQPPISTWCIGQACSMGSLLLTAGTPGLRHCLPNSRVMVHQPHGGARGQATDIAIQAEEILNLKRLINNIYVKHTGQPIEVIEKELERDKFLSADEAKDFGLVDRVLSHPPITESPLSNGDKVDS
ncbi:ATP-dependent Clp protease proteolytic subunit, mitochondrial-like isoform X2 [Porites lutea]|uniref:ATP-dependent Clp protease proteolytic subunit, mitochondrial-like isoform X2 n=1 Tax=Porites lutea TaxID=51062 RepID=UPI003CC51888